MPRWRASAKAARCRISTNRSRRAGEPRSPWRARRRDRSTDRPTSDGAGRADARAARSAARRARLPRRRRAPERSLSANDSTAMSPGVWPRSTASTISSRLVELVVSRCIAQSSDQLAARCVTAARSSPFSPITTSWPCARFGGASTAGRIDASPAGPTACTRQAQRLVGDGGKAFDAQHVEYLRRARRRARPAAPGRRSRQAARRRNRNRRGRAPASASCRVRRFSMSSSVPTPSPSSNASSTLPSVTVRTFTLRGSALGDRRQRAVDAGLVEEVALVEHDKIGAGDLILENFLDRIVMVERQCRLRAAA